MALSSSELQKDISKSTLTDNKRSSNSFQKIELNRYESLERRDQGTSTDNEGEQEESMVAQLRRNIQGLGQAQNLEPAYSLTNPGADDTAPSVATSLVPKTHRTVMSRNPLTITRLKTASNTY